MQKEKFIIFTDLDGTLLDHETYSFQAAQLTLDKCDNDGIPVIPVTSKTCSELLELRKKLDNQHPFVTENGGSIYIPENYFPKQPEQTTTIVLGKDTFWQYSLGKERLHWYSLINSLNNKFNGQFCTFHDLGKDGIAKATGLNTINAQLANTRDTSEPVKWLGSDQAKQQFIEALEKLNAQVVQGGRFLHVMDKACSKGIALQWIMNIFSQHHTLVHFTSISLGDSQNDCSMLETSNHAVIIRSPKHKPPAIHKKENVYLTSNEGPAGWSEAIEHLVYNTQ